MQKIKVFIDGSVGTTGLRIHERLSERQDIELIKLPEELRKDLKARIEAIKESDVTFLCLPDAASKEICEAVGDCDTKILDTSTAHRTNPAWAYGFPELSDDFRNKILASKRIAVPGCHASGFCSIVAPLVANGIISPDYPITATSVTGYSGGGKKMIAEYDDENRPAVIAAVKEITKVILTTYFLCGIMEVLSGALKALGASVLSTIGSLVGVIVRVIWAVALVMNTEKFHTVFWLYSAFPISWIISIVMLAAFLVYIWKKLGIFKMAREERCCAKNEQA